MQAELGIVAEETNILWWLFSEHSRDELKRWADYSVPAAALMAGKELADLTRVLPGPPAASAFLDRVIRCANRKPPASISVVDAINGVALDWRQKYTETSIPPELEDIMPISFGIKASTATPENDTWLPGFLRTTGLRQESKLAPELLSLQVFLERLLRRAWELST